MQNLSKLQGVFKIRHQNSISAIEQKKWMQYQSITIQKLFMDDMCAYLNYFFLLILFASFNWNIIYIYFLVLSFKAQQRRFLWLM
jgi:hypothetical protein